MKAHARNATLVMVVMLLSLVVIVGCGSQSTEPSQPIDSEQNDVVDDDTNVYEPEPVEPEPLPEETASCSIDPNTPINRGMSKEEVLCLSEWGPPADTHTEYVGGELVEGWYYTGQMERFVSFVDGVVKYYGFL